MDINKLGFFFFIGLIFSAFLASLTPFIGSLQNGHIIRSIFLTIVAQTHFIIAYLYYIDILRVRLINVKKFLLFFGSFAIIVLLYYFTRYVWFTPYATVVSLLTLIYFLVHHIENIFYFGENFYSNFTIKKRTNINYWFITFSILFLATFLQYTYYILGDVSYNGIFNIWYFLILFGLLCFTVIKLYTKVETKKTLLLLSPLVIFTGPFLLQNIAFGELRVVVVFWHFFMWIVLYSLLLHFRNKKDLPKSIKKLPNFFVSKFLRSTKKSVPNFLMFYFVANFLVFFFYMLSANLRGVTPLDYEMIQNSVFWGSAYNDLWIFAHVTFTFFPKRIFG